MRAGWRGRPRRGAVRACLPAAASRPGRSARISRRRTRPDGPPRARRARRSTRPALAPTMPPMLNIAWKREMVGVPSSFSVATACAFIATSLAPGHRAVEKQRGEQRSPCRRPAAIASSDRQNPAAVQRAMRAAAAAHHQRAANRDRASPSRWPCPAARARARHRPDAARIFTDAMRDTHVETTRPCTRKQAITPQKARRRSFGGTSGSAEIATRIDAAFRPSPAARRSRRAARGGTA